MKGKLLLIIGLFCVGCAFPQNYKVVVAQKGDGIFSLLRNQGLDPVKYYGAFIELNKNKLKDGSTLELGQVYLIPLTVDNMNVRAQLVRIGDSVEQPLLNDRLGTISMKGDELKEAIFYLISADSPGSPDQNLWKQTRELNLLIAQELVEHGAQVFLIEPDRETRDLSYDSPSSAWVPEEERTESSLASLELMKRYVEEINKRYLRHPGAYQRTLLTRLDGPLEKTGLQIRIMHYRDNQESKLVARKLRELFRKENPDFQDYTSDVSDFFKHTTNLYLGRNALTPVTLLEFVPTGKGIRPDRKQLSKLIADGFREDYARIQFAEEE